MFNSKHYLVDDHHLIINNNNKIMMINNQQLINNKNSSKSMTTLPLIIVDKNMEKLTKTTTTTTATSGLFTLPRNHRQNLMMMKKSTSVVGKDLSVNGKEMIRSLPLPLNNNIQQQHHPQSNPFYMNHLIAANRIAQPFVNSWKNRIKNLQESTATILINNNHNNNHHHNHQKISQFMAQYKGSAWREKQLQYQMPDHDDDNEQIFNDHHHQSNNNNKQKYSAEYKFLRHKRRKALIRTELCQLDRQQQQQQPQTCYQCKNEIGNQIHCVKAIISSNESPSSSSNQKRLHRLFRYYHIDCFTCCECNQVLVDLKGFIHPDNSSSLSYKLYCGRHFVELFKPRCPQCQRLIFDDECTEAEGKAWHIGHFCCTECQRSLGGQQYIMANNSGQKSSSSSSPSFESKKPYCLTCFDILFGDLCEECGELIGCETGAIVHEGRSWHADHRCFRCSLCMKNLLGQPFLPAMDGRIYCSISCSQAMQAHRKKRLKQRQQQNQHHQQQQQQQNRSEKNQTTLSVRTDDNIIDNRLSSGPSSSSSSSLMQFRRSQMVDYVEFIKKNNQCFTSKYDWSKEQEFVDVVEHSSSINNDVSSQTSKTTTTTEISEDPNECLQRLTFDNHHQQQQMPKFIPPWPSNILPSSMINDHQCNWQKSPPPEYCNLLVNSDNSSNCSSLINMTRKLNQRIDSIPENVSIDSNNSNSKSSQEMDNGSFLQSPSTLNNENPAHKSQSTTKIANLTTIKSNKSVSFDPNIQDKLSDQGQIRMKKTKHRSNRNYRSSKSSKNNCNDDQYDSCSSCSTCSSNTSSSSSSSCSSDEDDDQFDLDFQKFLKMGHLVDNNNDKKQSSSSHLNGNNNNDGCIIS
uniref:Protein espinas-like n=1 Tax=Dermatophagoides pteronyssinus TaxID=6956 RepID=A0A6P6YKX1_DERPT|nr:protein espinas-like [Dermatophagoides pteronyssinus]